MGAISQVNIPATEDALVPEVLAEYGAAVRAAMEPYLPQREPAYLYDLMAEYPRRGGKMMRSSLCIAMARATGASMADALPTAVSIELMHNALLVHDDIQDDSDLRRGKPTLHVLHGVPLAINAGDAMALLAFRPLKSNLHVLGPATALRILEETERMGWESAEGQALELGWERDNRVDLEDDDYLRMVLQKTCWLTAIHPMRVGCLIGARGRIPLDPLMRLGFFFGAAFQIQDDLLNLEAGEAYGKEINGDLLEGKRTLMIVHARRMGSRAERQRLTEFMGRKRAARTAEEVRWVRELLDRTGAMEHARTMAHALAGSALREFDAYFDVLSDSRDRRFMRSLLIWVMRRLH